MHGTGPKRIFFIAKRASIRTRKKNALESEYPRQLPVLRPTVRSECMSIPRPCPFVSCKYHLYLDVSLKTGSIQMNFPHLDVHELAHSCALDEADMYGGLTKEEVAERMNLTKQAVHLVERNALSRIRNVSNSEREEMNPIPETRQKIFQRNLLRKTKELIEQNVYTSMNELYLDLKEHFKDMCSIGTLRNLFRAYGWHKQEGARTLAQFSHARPMNNPKHSQ